MSNSEELYKSYVTKMHRIADVRNASAVLQWDQETYLPSKGAQFRGQQISTLSEMSHHLFSEDALGNILQELLQRNDLNADQKRNVQLTHEDYVKNKKYTPEFVRALSEQTNKAFHTWIESRKKNSFEIYQKDLDALVKLKREEADILGYEGHPYNALLNEFEKGCTVDLLDKSFNTILPTLKDLIDKISASKQVNDSFLRQRFPKQQQWDWGMHLIRKLNFDFDAGRQDISEHPFSVSFNKYDVRITTRVDENDFANMTWSCIHETGHALYEQGLPEQEYGLPLGEACSYSIHESQSRLWENNVGRSRGFWQHYYPQLKEFFPAQFDGVSLDEFYSGINKVEPSFVRTEADEITYHFHVYVRYELEKSLLDKSISTSDIPGFWNSAYKKYLGVEVPDDRKGCLQDVHWSHGSFGYFPTYSLGSLYAAQLFEAAKRNLPGLEAQIADGNTIPLLGWLREKVHKSGRFFTSEELCREITGKTLDASHFVDYLLDKYVSIYTL